MNKVTWGNLMRHTSVVSRPHCCFFLLDLNLNLCFSRIKSFPHHHFPAEQQWDRPCSGCCVLQSDAQELTIVKMSKFGGGIGAPSKEESLKEAADIHLRLGQIQRYCELMVELGQVGHQPRLRRAEPPLSPPSKTTICWTINMIYNINILIL